MKYSVLQEQRLKIMTAIAQEMANEDAVLKGGTALLLCYDLDRFSEDMDFDGGKRFSLDRAKKLINIAFDKVGVKITNIILKKDTPTTKRFMYHYEVEGDIKYAYPLKIEFSFRQTKEISVDEYGIVDGIKVYNIETLAQKKLAAFWDRMAPRDIYDIAFLIRHYPYILDYSSLQDIHTMNINAVTKVFESVKSDDELLKNIDGQSLILEMVENVGEQLDMLESEKVEYNISDKDSGSEM